MFVIKMAFEVNGYRRLLYILEQLIQFFWLFCKSLPILILTLNLLRVCLKHLELILLYSQS